MSKKFDEEFKAYITEDLPDLWDRIEASLPEKEVEKKAPVKRRKSFKKFIPIVVPSLCAVAVILILLPAFLLPLIRKNSSKGFPSVSGGTNGGSTPVNESADYARPETTGAAFAESVYEEMADAADDEKTYTQSFFVDTAGAGDSKNDGAAMEAKPESVEQGEAYDRGESEEELPGASIRIRVESAVLDSDGSRRCRIELLEELPEDFPLRVRTGETLECVLSEESDDLPGEREECTVLLQYKDGADCPLIVTYKEM